MKRPCHDLILTDSERDTLRRAFCVVALLATVITALMLTSCASPKVRTTTTARNLAGAEVTTVTETPWVDPFDQMMADVGRMMIEGGGR